MASFPHLNELIEGCVAGVPLVSRRRMFGGDVYFVGDAMFAAILKSERIVVRLPATNASQALLAIEGAEPWFLSPRKRMSNWVVVPEAFHDDDEALRPWLRQATQLNLAAKAASKRAAGAKTARSRV